MYFIFEDKPFCFLFLKSYGYAWDHKENGIDAHWIEEAIDWVLDWDRVIIDDQRIGLHGNWYFFLLRYSAKIF